MVLYYYVDIHFMYDNIVWCSMCNLERKIFDINFQYTVATVYKKKKKELLYNWLQIPCSLSIMMILMMNNDYSNLLQEWGRK